MNTDWLPVFVGVWMFVGMWMFRPRTDSAYTRARFRQVRREKAERYRRALEHAMKERDHP